MIADETYRTIAATCSCATLRSAARRVTHLFDAVMRPTGLYVTQFILLVSLRQAGPVTINQFAKQLDMDRTTLTRNLRPLQDQGFITVVPGTDQRTKVIELTEQGRATLDTAVPCWEQAQNRVIAEMGHDQWTLLMRGLGTVALLTG